MNNREIAIIILGVVIVSVIIGIYKLNTKYNSTDIDREPVVEEVASTTEIKDITPVGIDETDSIESIDSELEELEEFGEIVDEIPDVDEVEEVVSNTTPIETQEVEEVEVETKPTIESAYVSYNEASVREVAANGTAVLFFHAPWCPTCRRLDKEIKNEVSTLPDGVVIFKTDYDSESQLKKKYGVTYQHTLVVVDENLDLVKKWSGGGFDEVLFQVNS